MLDTNICIEIIRQRTQAVLRKLQQIPPAEICISAVTLSELEYGVAKSAAPQKNRLALAEFMTPITILPYNDFVAPAYGQIRAFLESKGTPIGALDIMLAAHALALNLTMVTTNEREFRRVPGLQVVTWR